MMEDQEEKRHLEPGDLKEGNAGWKWETSISKAILRKKLWDGEIPMESPDSAEVWRMVPIFEEETDYVRWNGRFGRLFKLVKKDMQCNADAVDGYQRDRHLYPMSAHDSRGKPHWKGSDADNLIKADVGGTMVPDGSGKDAHNPQLLGDTRQLVNANPDVFDGFTVRQVQRHIHQEIWA
jgi:hypothetical protein